jgi:arginase
MPGALVRTASSSCPVLLLAFLEAGSFASFSKGRNMPRSLSIIGAPSSAGAYAPGQEKAPAAFRRNGLLPALTRTGRRVHDRSDVFGVRWRLDPARPKSMNSDLVQKTATEVANAVAEALLADEDVLVLGGDCTVELGTVAGACRGTNSVGLVYIDLDTDLNAPEASAGCLDWTGVAHLLDIPGAEPSLSGLGPRRPMLAPGNILYFGTDNITPGEARTMGQLRLAQIPLREVKADPEAAAQRAVAWAKPYSRLLVHLDVDVLAFTDFPIAENTRRRLGLTLDELMTALSILLAAPNWRALTITEVNPEHAPDEAETFGRLNERLSSALAAGVQDQLRACRPATPRSA